MKDFKDSYEQKRWESAVRSHNRATAWLLVYGGTAGAQDVAKYWRDLQTQCESDYPCLKPKENAK